jgi:endonuclease/exonuclease/phosphatase family metal-dependent hydrolase
MGPAAEVSVVTFNIRGVMDRWPERAPVLKQCLKQADADVVCFQEVLTGEIAAGSFMTVLQASFVGSQATQPCQLLLRILYHFC